LHRLSAARAHLLERVLRVREAIAAQKLHIKRKPADQERARDEELTEIIKSHLEREVNGERWTVEPPFDVDGPAARFPLGLPNDDFVQPGNLYREVMKDTDRQNLVRNIVDHLGKAKKRIQPRKARIIYKTGTDYSRRVAEGLGLDVKEVERLAKLSREERGRRRQPDPLQKERVFKISTSPRQSLMGSASFFQIREPQNDVPVSKYSLSHPKMLYSLHLPADSFWIWLLNMAR
jgi:hypothetical protein